MRYKPQFYLLTRQGCLAHGLHEVQHLQGAEQSACMSKTACTARETSCAWLVWVWSREAQVSVLVATIT